MMSSSYNPHSSQEQSRLKFPKFETSWSNKLPRDTIFVASQQASSRSTASPRPTWGQEVYFCDLGASLIVVAKEKSGQIRAVNYQNVGTGYNQNIWSIDDEFPKNKAEEFFNTARQQFIKPEPQQKLPRDSIRISKEFLAKLKEVA